MGGLAYPALRSTWDGLLTASRLRWAFWQTPTGKQQQGQPVWSLGLSPGPDWWVRGSFEEAEEAGGSSRSWGWSSKPSNPRFLLVPPCLGSASPSLHLTRPTGSEERLWGTVGVTGVGVQVTGTP